jgi:chromosome partitioning protein
MRIISIANQKGGCGKTTTSINLAATLALFGKKILLIDLDPQAHASLGLNFEDQDSIYNVISNITPRKLDIFNIIKSVAKNLDIVPSNILVGTLEQELADEIGRELKLTEIMNKIRNDYDYILIDCPPNLGFLTINALRASDEVVIPVETSRYSIQGVEHLMDIINLIKERLNHPVTCSILITMFDSRLRHSFAMLSQIREKFSDYLLETIVHTNVKLKESAVLGQTVTTYDKYCRGSKDYMSLAREILTREQGVGQGVVEQPKFNKVKTAQPAEVPVAPVTAIPSAKEKEEEPVAAAALAAANPQEVKDIRTFQPLSERMQNLVKAESQDLLWTSFLLEAPDAQSVYVTGSFNDWSLDENCRMKYNNEGRWEVNVPLHPGVYKYQFIVDGRWREDPTNPRQERNSFGDINSIIEVKSNGKIA